MKKEYKYTLIYEDPAKVPPGVQPVPLNLIRLWARQYKGYPQFGGASGRRVLFVFKSETERELFAAIVAEGYRQRGYLIEPVLED